MISCMTLKVDAEGIEHMFIRGRVNKEINESFICNLFRNELNEVEREIYDQAVSISSQDFKVEILNTESEIKIDRMTSNDVNDLKKEIDFATLDISDKKKLNDFLQLIHKYCVKK